MIHSLRLVIRLAAALVFFILPRNAVAGPIEWGYRTQVTYDHDYGSRFEVMLAPDGTVAATPGAPGAVWLFSSTGVARPEPGSYQTVYDFGISVTITDHASGESGTLHYTGWYSSMWSYQPEHANNPDAWRWDWEVSDFGNFWDARTLELGRNLYTVRAYGGASGSFPSGEMLVEVSPTLGTPEPGTLALAGLGLVAVGLVRWRLRNEK